VCVCVCVCVTPLLFFFFDVHCVPCAATAPATRLVSSLSVSHSGRAPKEQPVQQPHNSQQTETGWFGVGSLASATYFILYSY